MIEQENHFLGRVIHLLSRKKR